MPIFHSEEADKNYGRTDQDVWRKASRENIDYVASRIKEGVYFWDLLKELSSRRQALGQELGHDNPIKYGQFLGHYSNASEHFKTKHGCIESAIREVESLFEDLTIFAYGYEDEGVELSFERDATLQLTIKNPFKNLRPKGEIGQMVRSIYRHLDKHSTNIHMSAEEVDALISSQDIAQSPYLSTVLKKVGGFIELKYRTYDKYNFCGDYLATQALLEELLASDTLEMFLECAARFSYQTSHMMFTGGGTAATTEWIVYGIAQYLGFELGELMPDRMGWSYRALVTLDVVDYIAWYKSHVFENARQHLNEGPAIADMPPSLSQRAERHGFAIDDKTRSEVTKALELRLNGGVMRKRPGFFDCRHDDYCQTTGLNPSCGVFTIYWPGGCTIS